MIIIVDLQNLSAAEQHVSFESALVEFLTEVRIIE